MDLDGVGYEAMLAGGMKDLDMGRGQSGGIDAAAVGAAAAAPAVLLSPTAGGALPDFDFALEDLGDLIKPVNDDADAGVASSFIGYDDGLFGATTARDAPFASLDSFSSLPPASVPPPLPLAAATQRAGVQVGAARRTTGAPVSRSAATTTTTLQHKRSADTVASLSASAVRRRPAKRARTRYTAQLRDTKARPTAGAAPPPPPQRMRGNASAGVVVNGRGGDVAPATAVAAPAPAGRKNRKNNRERQRRIEVNEGFRQLAELLQVQRKTKSDKVTVLSAAVREITTLRARVAQLEAAAGAGGGAGGPATGQPLHRLDPIDDTAMPTDNGGANPAEYDSRQTATAAAASFAHLMELQLAESRRAQQGGAAAGMTSQDIAQLQDDQSLLDSVFT